MGGFLRKIFRHRPFALTMRRRVLLYFLFLNAILLTCLIPLLISFGLCPVPEKEIGRALDSYIISYERSVSEQMSSTAARAILLGQKLSGMIERTLGADGIPFRPDFRQSGGNRSPREQSCLLVKKRPPPVGLQRQLRYSGRDGKQRAPRFREFPGRRLPENRTYHCHRTRGSPAFPRQRAVRSFAAA